MPSSVLLVTVPFCLPGVNVCCHTEGGVQAPQQGVAETPSLDLSPQKGNVAGCSSQTCLGLALLVRDSAPSALVSEPSPFKEY